MIKFIISDEYPTLEQAKREFERDYISRVLSDVCGNVTKAAFISGRNRTEFYKIIKRNGLKLKEFRSA